MQGIEHVVTADCWTDTINFLVHCLVSPQSPSMGFDLVMSGSFPFGTNFPPHPTVTYRKCTKKHDPDEYDSSKRHRRKQERLLKRTKSFADSEKYNSNAPSDAEEFEDEVSYFFGLMSPHQAAFPIVDFDMSLLFYSLSVLNIISVFECILGESKIVFLSTKAKLLTHVIQAFLTLIWPFSWVCNFAFVS